MPTPLPTLPGVYYCYLHGKNGSLTTGNTYTFKTSAPPSDPAQDATWAGNLASILPTSWGSTMAPLYPSTVTGWDSRVYPLGHPTLPPALGHTTHDGAGGAQLAPIAVSAVIRHQVTRRGRGSQSHTSISPLPKNATTDDGQSVADGPRGTYTTTFEDFIGSVQAAWNALVAGVDLLYVQLSKKGTGATYPITASFCEVTLGTERSRTTRP